MVLEEIKPTASPRDLLEIDSEQPLFRLENHPIWKMALSGEMSREQMSQLILLIYPVFAGPGRYLFSAKLSQISAEDGAMMFRQLYEANKTKEADADAGWRRVGLALDLKEKEFDTRAANPSPEAYDLLTIIRQHSLRSSPSSAAAVAWATEHQLPGLIGKLADSLSRNYSLDEGELVHLHYQKSRAEEVNQWVEHLLSRYFDTATPYEIYEARRASWEVIWGWTALIESLN